MANGQKILIVDDECETSGPVAKYLERAGYETQCAPNGRDALAMLISGSWDALVLDMRMPDMNGVELLQVLRSYLRWTDLPVIFLTGNADSAQEEMAIYLGARRIFRKGAFKLEDLLGELQEALRGPARAEK